MEVTIPLLIALQAALAVQPTSPVPNGDFEQVDEHGSPADWRVEQPSAGSSYRLTTQASKDGRRVARLYNTQPAGGDRLGFAQAVRWIDAAPYRGMLVRVEARARSVRPEQPGSFGFRVIRAAPKTGGFRSEVPITSSEWATHGVVGRVAEDALRIEISFLVQGAADLLFDDVSIRIVKPNPTPPTADAAAYLDKAIQLLRDHHIDSSTADWERIISNAREEIGGATKPSDTYSAIRGVIGELGEPHTFLTEPIASASNPAGRADPDPPMPTYKLIDGRFGAVRLPWHGGSPEQGERYTATLRKALQLLDAQKVCGWIVDLRGNSGGNMWPMMNGLDPLLGTAPFGSFYSPSREPYYWIRSGGQIAASPRRLDSPPAFRLRSAAAPVSILVDEWTASSGEMVAIAFKGRGNTMMFGSPTRSRTTVNAPFQLSDGAELALTVGFTRDRSGREYRGALAPDSETGPADTESAAVGWLARQPCAATWSR